MLRHLEYHKILGKTKPPQTLYWHSLNTFHAARTISKLLPAPLNETELRILGWSALLHDAGKEAECWQKSGHGRHFLDEPAEARVRDVLSNSALTNGHGPQSEQERDVIIELVREHHTRRTLSTADIERILAILKMADAVVSAQRIDSGLVSKIGRFLQPSYKPIVLTAEQHPISHFALSVADQEVETKRLGLLLLANAFQSLYIVPEDTEVEGFKRRVEAAVRKIVSGRRAGENTLSDIYSWISAGPIRELDAFLEAVHTDRQRVLAEMHRELESRQKGIETAKRKGNIVDEDVLWLGPFRVLHHATQLYEKKPTVLLGTKITFPPPGMRKEMAGKRIARGVAKKLGCQSPTDYVNKVLDLIAKSTHVRDAKDIQVDVLTWSESTVDATRVAKDAYALYRETQWNSRTRKRNTAAYCFSCKRRKATREAPRGGPPTDTWTSAAVVKGKVHVCELCFIAQAYVLPQTEPGRFHVDATPHYNQARVDWEKIFWDGAVTREFKPHQVTSHHVVLPLARASTPNEALVAALGYTHKFEFEASKEYRSYADMLFLHGLHGAIGAGPQHAGPYTLGGVGIHITPREWEQYGPTMKVLKSTHLQKVFPANQVWRNLVAEPWGWGTLLAVRHRRGALKSYHVETVRELMRVKSQQIGTTLLAQVRGLPLHAIEDRDERFKAAESILRRMEQAVKRATKDPILYGGQEEAAIEIVAELGKKQLRSRLLKEKKSLAPDDELAAAQHALNAIADELWRLKDRHTVRQDFINATIMAIAYSPKMEAN